MHDPPKPAKRWGRRLAALAACTVAGAVVTLLVAWGCVLWEPGDWMVPIDFTGATPPEPWPVATPAWWPRQARFNGVKVNSGWTFKSYGDTRCMLRMTSAGWPLRSLAFYECFPLRDPSAPASAASTAPNMSNDGLRLPAWVPVNGRRDRVVPMRPLTLGFLADTVLYGAAFGLTLAGLLAWRRSKRRRAGRCPACGYDLAGLPDHAEAPLVCPECGARCA